MREEKIYDEELEPHTHGVYGPFPHQRRHHGVSSDDLAAQGDLEMHVIQLRETLVALFVENSAMMTIWELSARPPGMGTSTVLWM